MNQYIGNFFKNGSTIAQVRKQIRFMPTSAVEDFKVLDIDKWQFALVVLSDKTPAVIGYDQDGDWSLIKSCTCKVCMSHK